MGKAIKTRYRPMYGGNAGITEHSDGAVPPPLPHGRAEYGASNAIARRWLME